jgi:hypothetical protein
MAAPLAARESDTTTNTGGLEPESGMRAKVRTMTILGIKVSPDLGEVISHNITIDGKSSRKKGSNVNQKYKAENRTFHKQG